MSWFNSFATGVKNLLTIDNPTKVLEVQAEKYSKQKLHCREDSLTLYEDSNTFEIVLHRPCNETLYEAYSLCRCQTLEQAEIKFLQFKDKVPQLVNICKDLNHATQIQKVCDTLDEFPTWTVAHLVTHLNLPELLTEPTVSKFINSEEAITGMSPLQLAIQNQNMRMVQALLTHQASLIHFDNNNDSVLHYAARTNRQLLTVICEKSKHMINSKNREGHTPLHVACLSDKPECIYALVEMGADINSSAAEAKQSLMGQTDGTNIQEFARNLDEKAMKHGGTPLHWAVSRQIVQTLVNLGCDINNRNFDKKTALHVMVEGNRLECVVALLSLRARSDLQDKDGNTPLHLAVRLGHEAIIKALIVFGADLSIRNNAGANPRHCIACDVSPGDKILWILHSVGAPRCDPGQVGCNTGCQCDSNFNGVAPQEPLGRAPRDLIESLIDAVRPPPGSKPKKGRVLCLDGGGIRGLILVVVLKELEKEFQTPITHCFDWIAATSTGGILALALAAGKTLEEALCIYFKMKEIAFAGKRPYPSDAFEGVLKEVFGESTTMSQIVHPKVMVTATLADRNPVDLHLFRNYESPSDILGLPHMGPFQASLPPTQQLLWHVARATGAAPTYFRAFGRFIDGGLISNNPTLDALTEVHEYNAALRCSGREQEMEPISMVVSIGTGSVPLVQHKQEVDVFRLEKLFDVVMKTNELVYSISTLTQVLVDQATQSDGRVVDRARAWCSGMGVPYFRFSPQLSEDVAMDERSDEKLTNMLWETKAYMYKRRADLSALGRLLRDG